MPRNEAADADAMAGQRVPVAERPPITLESRLVRHDGGPDRRTIYPPGLSDVARMSTWLSADSEAFVDLEAVR